MKAWAKFTEEPTFLARAQLAVFRDRLNWLIWNCSQPGYRWGPSLRLSFSLRLHLASLRLNLASLRLHLAWPVCTLPVCILCLSLSDKSAHRYQLPVNSQRNARSVHNILYGECTQCTKPCSLCSIMLVVNLFRMHCALCLACWSKKSNSWVSATVPSVPPMHLKFCLAVFLSKSQRHWGDRINNCRDVKIWVLLIETLNLQV